MAQQGFIPVYQKLYNHYREEIMGHDYVPGDQIDSINRIMMKHKVSRETAKLVLRKLVEEGLVIQVPGKGSFVTSYSESNNRWGMVLPIQTSNMEELISHLQKEATARGRSLDYFFHYNNPDEEMRLVGWMIRESYDAVIVVPNFNEEETSGFYRKMIPYLKNLILIDFTMAGSWFNYVIQSYDLGIRRAIDHFMEHASGNILMVKNDSWKGRNLLADSMEYTFLSSIEENGGNRKGLVLEGHNQLTEAFITAHGIDGILCCQDTDALKVYAKVKEWGISVPEELSIINYGRTELLDLFSYPVSYIDCRYDEMAGKVAEIIDSDLGKIMEEQHVILPKVKGKR